MKIFKSYQDIDLAYRGCVIAIGNFDGVHRGHNIVLDQAKTIAADLNTKVGVLTFEPHPHVLFQPDSPPSRITPFAMKMERLAAAGLDAAFAVDFNWDFASQSAEDFIQDVLIEGLGAAHVVVGYDFCFGQLRKGSARTLLDSELPTTVVEKIIAQDGDEKLSSSAIRQHIRHGKITDANAILGWEWEIAGEVIKGDQRGRELGYPTANFDLGDTVHPAYGIYATLARIEGEEEWRPAATNIGIRPMFEVPTAQIETFIFDFDREIYGKTLHVRPVQYLRGEAKFDSLEDLIAQMDKDCEQAREILKA